MVSSDYENVKRLLNSTKLLPDTRM